MKENLINLVDGCVECHTTSADVKEARKIFRMNIEAAYDMGLADAKSPGGPSPARPAPDKGAEPSRPGETKQAAAATGKTATGKTQPASSKAPEGKAEPLSPGAKPPVDGF